MSKELILTDVELAQLRFGLGRYIEELDALIGDKDEDEDSVKRLLKMKAASESVMTKIDQAMS